MEFWNSMSGHEMGAVFWFRTLHQLPTESAGAPSGGARDLSGAAPSGGALCSSDTINVRNQEFPQAMHL